MASSSTAKQAIILMTVISSFGGEGDFSTYTFMANKQFQNESWKMKSLYNSQI